MIPIEETVFARKRWIEDRMLSYGFHKTKKFIPLKNPFLTEISKPSFPSPLKDK